MRTEVLCNDFMLRFSATDILRVGFRRSIGLLYEKLIWTVDGCLNMRAYPINELAGFVLSMI
jgi:hypothetical protein